MGEASKSGLMSFSFFAGSFLKDDGGYAQKPLNVEELKKLMQRAESSVVAGEANTGKGALASLRGWLRAEKPADASTLDMLFDIEVPPCRYV